MEIKEIINDTTIKETSSWFAQLHIQHRRQLDNEIKEAMTQSVLMLKAIANILSYVGIQHGDSVAKYEAIVTVNYNRTGWGDTGVSRSVSSSAKIAMQDYTGQAVSFFSDNSYIEQIWDTENKRANAASFNKCSH